MTEGIHHERLRCEDRLDFVEQERSLPGARDQARGGCAQDSRGDVDLRLERWDAGGAGRALGSHERCARSVRAQASHRDSSDDELVRGPRCGRQGRRVDRDEKAFRLLEAADQDEAPQLDVAGMRCVDAVAMGFERCARGVERLRGPAQVARSERDLRFGDDAACARDDVLRAKGPGRAPDQCAGLGEITELRHRDASQRERGRVVPQGDAVERSERVACHERTRRGRNQRIHSNPDKLVTPTAPVPRANLASFQHERHVERITR